MAPTTASDSSEHDGSPLLRVDSPLSTSPTMSKESCSSSQDSASSNTIASSVIIDQTRQPTGKKLPKNSSLRFFVFDHPTQLKDKTQLKINRKHVMQDYLNKERQKPSSTDVRVTGSRAGRKRKQVNIQRPRHPAHPGSLTTRSSDSKSSNAYRHKGDTIVAKSAPRRPEYNSPTDVNDVVTGSYIQPQRPIVFADDLGPLVHGIVGRSTYLSTVLDTVPDPTSALGTGLNPFDTWPRPVNPLINIEELKWKCYRNFGTQALNLHWIPALLKAKHAFLSTCAISSAFVDIMERGSQQPRDRRSFGSAERWAVQGEVISMINSAMKDPELRATDATIVSVLHLLNSEIMGCDGAIMAIHQRGLHDMIQARGGLKRLGVDGQLASILTITMYIISALREVEPHSDFVRYAEEKDTRPPKDEQKLPESPVYCRSSGYNTLRQAISSDSPLLELLDDLRCLTNAFVRASSASFKKQSLPNGSETPNLQSSYNKIVATQPASQRPQDFFTVRERDQFEALRLVAQVYAHALFHQVSLAKAATELAKQHDGTNWHIHIKQALIRTDLSDCWGYLGGVLFWATIVAGASANPDSP